MKQAEIKRCTVCGKGVMHDGQLLFWRLHVERMGINFDAVRRRHGLEVMMGSPVLAAVMGPDEDIARPVFEQKVIVCESCMIEQAGQLAETLLLEEAPEASQ